MPESEQLESLICLGFSLQLSYTLESQLWLDLNNIYWLLMFAEDGSEPHFVLNLESSHVSNLSAELTQMGFRSGEGVSPGRTLRIVQAITRAIMLTAGKSKQSLKAFDSKCDSWHRHLTKDTIDVAVCLAAESNVQRKSKSEPLMLHIAGTSDDVFGTKPLTITNEVELVSMIRAIKGDPAPSA